jgi:hypothetical protein
VAHTPSAVLIHSVIADHHNTLPGQLCNRRSDVSYLPPEDGERLHTQVVDLCHPQHRRTGAEHARERR